MDGVCYVTRGLWLCPLRRISCAHTCFQRLSHTGSKIAHIGIRVCRIRYSGTVESYDELHVELVMFSPDRL